MLVEVSPTVAFSSSEISSVEKVFDDSRWQYMYLMAPMLEDSPEKEKQHKEMLDRLAKAPARFATKYTLKNGTEYMTQYKDEDEAEAEFRWAKALVNSQDE